MYQILSDNYMENQRWKKRKNSTDDNFSPTKLHKKRIFHDILQYAPKQRKFKAMSAVCFSTEQFAHYY